MKVSLVCIAKNEDLYIEEWIEYNLKLGFDHIFIYQNDWRFSKDYENITKIDFDGNVKQLSAYNHFIENYHTEYDWSAFFDVDEFLVLKKHNNIKDFIEDYKKYKGIGINWVLFGNNNIETTTNDFSVIKRFTKRQQGVNPHVKVILKLSSDLKMRTPHNSNVYIVDTNLKKFRNSSNDDGDDNVAQLNHYFVKTRSEFIEKINRGRADTKKIREVSEFELNNLNEIEDLTALNFYIR